MNKSKAKKIQELLTLHLLTCGEIRLLLPDGVELEIGCVQNTKHGVQIAKDYCFVKASRDGNATLLDAYNVGLQYSDETKHLVCLDDMYDKDGRSIKTCEVV